MGIHPRTGTPLPVFIPVHPSRTYMRAFQDLTTHNNSGSLVPRLEILKMQYNEFRPEGVPEEDFYVAHEFSAFINSRWWADDAKSYLSTNSRLSLFLPMGNTEELDKIKELMKPYEDQRLQASIKVSLEKNR